MIYSINVYSVLFVGSIIVGLLYGLLNYRRLNTSKEELFLFGIFICIFGIIGSRLFSFLFRIKEAFQSFEMFKSLLFSGFMFYGGLLGGIIGVYVYTKRFKLNTLKYLDFCAVILPFCHMIGRIGCFYTGCCYGIPLNKGDFLAFDFNNDGNYYLATQLIEAGFNLLLCVFLYILYKNPALGSIGKLCRSGILI